MIKFVLLVNKQGQTRLAKYLDAVGENVDKEQRLLRESEIVRKCLKRTEKDCNYIEHRGTRVVYRRYASLFFMVGVDTDDNELAALEFIHTLVEAMDKWFGNVCELDIMFSLDVVRRQDCICNPSHDLIDYAVYMYIQAYAIIDEMIGNGWVIDSNKSSILAPMKLMEKSGSVAS